jgi:Ferritin-like
MRARHVRLLSVPAATRTNLELALADTPLNKPDELTWWDWAVFLLHTAAEIEHALLVQYLYAAYSLADTSFTGPRVPTEPGALTGNWRLAITEIAREEMAHLLTVQNLLRFIGGPLNLEREDFPFLAFLYPFPFALEPLTKDSLAKYVAAEMPADPAQPPEVIGEIIRRATGAAGGMPVNRVGQLYETLTGIFQDPSKLADSDLRTDLPAVDQASPGDWHAPDHSPLVVRVIGSRDLAVLALQDIGAQGEGSATVPSSHFDRFLAIYQAFPDAGTLAEPAAWVPARSIPSGPNTMHEPSEDPAVERGRITDPTARRWATLFNVRYRMLLADLAHFLQLPGPLQDQSGTPTSRGHLRDWAFSEMGTGIRGIAQVLITLPLKETPGPGDPDHAGPPFELPYTLTLPDDEHDRWRLHLALLDASSSLIGGIEAASGPSSLLTRMKQSDLQAKAIAAAQP